MSDLIAAEEGALRAGADAVATASVAISGQAQGIQGEGDSLKAFWQGAAAQRYTGLVDAWVQKAQQLVASLNGLEENLRGTDKDLAATEEQHVQTTSRMSGLLG